METAACASHCSGLPENPLLLYMEIIKHRSSAKDGKMPCGKNIRKYALIE
jgi:hypothetical protein